MTAVQQADPELEMPPKKKLPPEAIADLSQWIRAGAVWPEGKGLGFATGEIKTTLVLPRPRSHSVD